MINLGRKDGAWRESSTFSSLVKKVVVTVGFDKSDSDFLGTCRICNHHKGNLSNYAQLFASLEGPVAENYQNEMKTIGNDSFPMRATVQVLFNDHLQSM